jgi:hypothetical protein
MQVADQKERDFLSEHNLFQAVVLLPTEAGVVEVLVYRHVVKGEKNVCSI